MVRLYGYEYLPFTPRPPRGIFGLVFTGLLGFLEVGGGRWRLGIVYNYAIHWREGKAGRVWFGGWVVLSPRLAEDFFLLLFFCGLLSCVRIR